MESCVMWLMKQEKTQLVGEPNQLPVVGVQIIEISACGGWLENNPLPKPTDHTGKEINSKSNESNKKSMMF